MPEPKLTQISVSASFGGKLQLVKFELTADYHLSESRTYSVPEEWTEEQIEEFRQKIRAQLQASVGAEADREFQALIEQKEELNG